MARRFAISLPEFLEVGDHAIAGRATAPAVELLDLLVKFATKESAGSDWNSLSLPLVMRDVAFPRFLPMEETNRCTFEITLERLEEPSAVKPPPIRATFTSRITLAGNIQRTRIHAQVTLGGRPPPMPHPPDLPVPEIQFAAERVYSDLIPFGPRFRNLHGMVYLSRDGGTGVVSSPALPHPSPSFAGCPYLLDGAMHLACLWGQRYAGFIAYPTGFAARVIILPIAQGERRCLVVPRVVKTRHLCCDLWLVNSENEVCDVINDLAMVPLAGGASPPDWIVHPAPPPRFAMNANDLTTLDIEKLIPHRAPMRLVQAITKMDGDSIETEATVLSSWPTAQDGRVRTLVLIELLAQTAATLQGWRERHESQVGQGGLLVGVHEVKLAMPTVAVGTRLRCRARETHGVGNYKAFEGRITGDDDTLWLQGTVQAYRPDFSSPDKPGEST
jgi:predicted hotdog family 3-hydroxylacyl-ACP dehydratase